MISLINGKAVTVRFKLLDGNEVSVNPAMLLYAGFASRDRAKAIAHRDELVAEGVAVPASIPCIFKGDPGTLSQEARISEDSPSLRCEVELVAFRAQGQVYITVGCDLYRADLESHSIEISKQACATPIASRAMPLEFWEDDPDQFFLWMKCDNVLRQEANVAELLPMRELLALNNSSAPKGDFVLFSGTIPFLEPVQRRPSTVSFGLSSRLGTGSIQHSFEIEDRPPAACE